MKVGLIARAEDRGLGHMTWDFHTYVEPERTLVVDMTGVGRPFVQHLDRYPDAAVTPYNGGELDADDVARFLDGLDVVYSAETFYDPAFVFAAEQLGVATVLHVMPEFLRPDWPAPTVLWAPTSWRVEQLPSHRSVPVPITPRHVERRAGAQLRVLHVAGNPAASDRNGTRFFANALRHVTVPVEARIITQAGHLPMIPTSRAVTFKRTFGGVHDRWDLYADADVMVLPRRYGGLCLPALEAMASGVAVVMPDCSPNRDWPVGLMPTRSTSNIETPAGTVAMHDVDPRTIAATIDRLASDPDEVRASRELAVAWSAAHSWDQLLPLYRRELERACR